MSTVVPLRPTTNGNGGSTSATTYIERQPSFSSFPSSRKSSNLSLKASHHKLSSQASVKRRSPANSQKSSSKPPSVSVPDSMDTVRPRQKRLKSQYPMDSAERHVEYVLVASFHIDRGPIMEHQYPGPISGDEHMLAELMLPDQAHMRNQDWTVFFLHKDTSGENEEEYDDPQPRRRKERGDPTGESSDNVDDSEGFETSDDEEGEDDEGGEGPPLMYVLNLVNTKQDSSAPRGAVVKAMAICTRHSFLHIYKPLLLLALEDYFKNPQEQTLASLYDAVNAMDLSLMPRLSLLERSILQSSDTKDMFVEKFERMIQQRMADEAAAVKTITAPDSPTKAGTKFSVPRDTHEFETKVLYNDIPIPIKVPTAVSPETVGDFSLIKLIQTFAGPHASSPQPFMLHPHLTTSGAFTHPIIVLINAILTEKRIVFVGHNRPSGEVAEGVLAACALASGGVLRGFTRHAFPYTDLTKIDDLLKVPGFIAGVTNLVFANHPEWWDLLCDLPTGRMKISSKIEPAPVTEGFVYFQQQHPAAMIASNNSSTNPASSDPTGDAAFLSDLLNSITSRHGEAAVRNKWRNYITRFTRIAAVFEESVYGASALHIAPETNSTDSTTTMTSSPSDPISHLRGHGYVWPDEATKQRELASQVSRIEGWRNTRSYYAFIQDLAILYPSASPSNPEVPHSNNSPARPIKSLDLHHHHDRLRTLKLSHSESAAIYLALSATVRDYNGICQLLTVTPESQGGLFYISLGLFHPDAEVRSATVVLLDRIRTHEAGRHFWNGLGRFARLAWNRVKLESQAQVGTAGEGGGGGGSLNGVVMGEGSLGMGYGMGSMGSGSGVGRAS